MNERLYWCQHIGKYSKSDDARIGSVILIRKKEKGTFRFRKRGEFEFCPCCGQERPVQVMVGE